ncbi:MAG TPA: DUF3352 domain-containing protein [Planctomycetota bacterium]|nr:DUF3352 domain-containing protein [Planctomycetota bacterium]
MSYRLKRTGIHCTLVVAFLLGRASAGEKAPTIADILPDGTIMFAEVATWSHWSKDFNNTSLARIFSEPEVRTFLAGPFSQVSTLIRKATELKENPDAPAPKAPAPQPGTANAVSSFFALMSDLARGPFSVAVRYSPEDAQAKRVPAVAVVLGLSDQQNVEATNNVLAGVLDKLLKDWKIEAVTVTDYQNTKLLSLTTEAAGQRKNVLTLMLHKGRLVFSNEVKLCTQIIDGMAGTLAKRLSDTEAYKNTGLAGDEHLIAFLDVAGLQKALGAVEQPADAPNQLDDFFVLAGLNKTIAVAWSLKMSGPAFESRTAIFTQGERQGLLGTLSEEPVSNDALKLCARTTPLAAAFRLQPEKVMPFIRNAVKAVQGQKGLEDLNTVEKQLNAELGKDLEAEVRAAFGNEVVVTSLAQLDNAGPIGAVSAFAASLSIKDAKRAEELLAQVLTRVSAKMDPNGVAANVLKEVEFDGGKIRYMNPPRLASIIGVSPAFMVAENRLVMALDVPTLKRAIKTLKSSETLADSEALKTGLGGVGGKLGPMFSYVDWAYMYKSVFSLSTAALKLVAPTDILKEIGIDMNLLPSTETVSQHLFPGMSVARITPNGVMLTSRSPVPSMEVIAPPMAAVTAVFASFRPFVMPPAKK